MTKTKPFEISKWTVLEAYQRVKANKGACGIDDESLDAFGKDWQNNLYKIWNRMSSGTYFPPAVRTVEIPKGDGGVRKLGIPTVSDRIAQMVVKLHLEPLLEPLFHESSYGYRPNKSALDAVDKARRRCSDFNWVIDLDIKGFFDNLDHELLLKAVRKHTNSKWILLYVERWLKAPAQLGDGSIVERRKGTPQGGVISPLLANLFLHYAFDVWMTKTNPYSPFERYADDVIVHCQSERGANIVLERIRSRLHDCHLELHPEKTKVVYCKDNRRRDKYVNIQFDFLGFTFCQRSCVDGEGQLFMGFNPGISRKASKRIRDTIRSWRIPHHHNKTLQEVADFVNPYVRGWLTYYGKYFRSALRGIFRQLNYTLVRWVCRKFKRFKTKPYRAKYWLKRLALSDSSLFYNWSVGFRP